MKKKKYQLIRAEPGTGKALVLRTGMSKKKAWGLYYSLVYIKYAF